MNGKATIPELAVARAEAGEELEAAIAALGIKFETYTTATNRLEFRLNQELSRYVESPIVLHLVKAGLSAYLERRLVGTAPPLRALIESQHRRMGVQT